MYYLLVLLTGMTLAVMISINGFLTQAVGIYLSAVIIHIVGSAFAGILVFSRRRQQKPVEWKKIPFWQYLGGAIGVFVTMCNNISFGRISMTSIVALGLLGQTAAALAIDCFGLFGMPKHPFRLSSLPGLLLSLAGIGMMLDPAAAAASAAVILSLTAGIGVVLNRTVNARISDRIGALRGSLMNHLTGLPITILLACVVFLTRGTASFSVRPFPLWVLTGGILGVMVVVLCNLTVPHVAAFRLTMITFVSQMMTGVLLDLILGKGSVDPTFWGGLVIAAGVVVSLIMEHMPGSRKQPAA